MLITGWKARGAALLLAAYTILSALIFHNFWAVPADQALNQTIHFMKNVAIMGGFCKSVRLVQVATHSSDPDLVGQGRQSLTAEAASGDCPMTLCTVERKAHV